MKEYQPSIAFFGSSLISAYWNGAATYYRGILKYLYRLGYDITFFEPDAFDRQKHIDLPSPDFARSVVYEATTKGAKRALAGASMADIIIKASGVGVLDDYLEQEILKMRQPHQMVIFWDVDAPATLDTVFRNPQSPFRKLIPQFDYILTYGGGQPVTDAYHSLGARECIPIYNAMDPDTHYPVAPQQEYLCDLAFLGNRLPDREERVFDFFIQVAEMLPQKTFILGGSGWDNLSLPRNINYIGHVYTYMHNALNSSAKAILNISRQSMADYGFSPATRIFEAAGAGACMITDNWEGIEQFFTPSEEIWVADSGLMVADLLTSLSETQMKETGQRALKKVLSRHTYLLRASQAGGILEKQKSLAAGPKA